MADMAPLRDGLYIPGPSLVGLVVYNDVRHVACWPKNCGCMA